MHPFAVPASRVHPPPQGWLLGRFHLAPTRLQSVPLVYRTYYWNVPSLSVFGSRHAVQLSGTAPVY